MYVLEQGEAAYIPVRLYDATDHVTPETSITGPTITVAKNGGAAGASSATWTEIGSGVYWVGLTAADTNTLGVLVVRVVASGCDTAVVTAKVDAVTNADLKEDIETKHSVVISQFANQPGAVAAEILGTAIDGGVDVETILKDLLANLTGKWVLDDGAGTVTVYAQDGTSILYTHTITSTQRTTA